MTQKLRYPEDFIDQIVGLEISKRYCEVAQERLGREGRENENRF